HQCEIEFKKSFKSFLIKRRKLIFKEFEVGRIAVSRGDGAPMNLLPLRFVTNLYILNGNFKKFFMPYRNYQRQHSIGSANICTVAISLLYIMLMLLKNY